MYWCVSTYTIIGAQSVELISATIPELAEVGVIIIVFMLWALHNLKVLQTIWVFQS